MKDVLYGLGIAFIVMFIVATVNSPNPGLNIVLIAPTAMITFAIAPFWLAQSQWHVIVAATLFGLITYLSITQVKGIVRTLLVAILVLGWEVYGFFCLGIHAGGA